MSIAEEMVVRGSLMQIQILLELIKDHLEYRKTMGWEPFQGDEAWSYSSMRDEHVCPICQAFDERHSFVGTDIPSVFPDNQWIDINEGMLYPNTHQTYTEFRGKCRCYMQWLDPLGTLVKRLRSELVI